MEERNYEDEISLRELLTILLNSWKLIATITVLAAVLGGSYAWFIASPSYESKIRGIIDIPETVETKYGTYTFTIQNNMDYLSIINSNNVLSETINDLELETNVESLENRISINTTEESDVFTFVVTAGSPEKAKELMLSLRNNFLEELNFINKEKAINHFIRTSFVELQAYEEKEQYLTDDILNTEVLLETIQPTIVLQKSVLDDPLIAAAIIKNKGISFEELSDEMMLVEEINPNFIEMENKIILLKDELKDLNIGKTKNQRFYDELTNEKTNLAAVRWANGENSLKNGLLEVLSSAVLIDENPSVSSNPVAPRKMLILAISLVLGLMIGVFTAFFKAYWNESK